MDASGSGNGVFGEGRGVRIQQGGRLGGVCGRVRDLGCFLVQRKRDGVLGSYWEVAFMVIGSR